MIPTTWGGNLIPQERRRLCRSQGQEILGRLGAARQRQRGPHLAVFLTLVTHLRRPTEDVARDLVTQILGDHVAGARDDAVRHGHASRPQPPMISSAISGVTVKSGLFTRPDVLTSSA